MDGFDFSGTGIRPLGRTELAEVTLVPALRTGVVTQPFQISGYTPDGQAHPAFTLRRHFGTSGIAPAAPAEARLEGDWVYGGLFIPHWGHFLLESLARVWALRGRGPLNVVWHHLNGRPEPLSWQAALLDTVGIAGLRHHIIDRPTVVERLSVPDAGFVLGTYLHATQAIAIAAHRFRKPVAGRRVWLSRSRMKLGSIEGEETLEQTLAAAGWEVFHPQEHDVPTQLAFLEDAETISGFEGSAFHTLILGAGIEARIRIMARSRNVAPNYAVIAVAKHLDQEFIAVETEHYDTVNQKPLFRIRDVNRAAALALRQ